ncbi:MAG TPA: aminoglycoside phosphotransferase family protein [Pseudonocardiaceae bacterium]|nr:aminoglycoside phosphotransferase family protein [Pseudonocardiaceae bacterium]
MIEALGTALCDSPQPGLTELRSALQQVLDGSSVTGRFTGAQALKKTCNVYRLSFDINGRPRTLVAKCLNLPRAQRNRLVATRWLRAVGLGHRGPALLATAAERGGEVIWHVYEDFGDRTLDTVAPDWSRVEAAIDLIAELHVRFAEHPLLPEARMFGKDMGMTYYLTNIRDAIRALESLRPPVVDGDADQFALRDRLLSRLAKLLDEAADRAAVMAEAGGPETLLHGDLWPKNILSVPTRNGLQTRLIDWDATGVGPVTYDLSTFLYRFARHHRLRILERYQQAAEPLGWRVSSIADLSLLLETAEISRIANCLIWPCIEAVHAGADWAFDSLAGMETWFDPVEPALTPQRFAPAGQGRVTTEGAT